MITRDLTCDIAAVSARLQSFLKLKDFTILYLWEVSSSYRLILEMGGICSKKTRKSISKSSPTLQADQAHLPTNEPGVTSGYPLTGAAQVTSEIQPQFYCPKEGAVESYTKRRSTEEYGMLAMHI